MYFLAKGDEILEPTSLEWLQWPIPVISPLELFSSYPVNYLCVSYRLYLVGIPVQNDGSFLLVGGLGYESDLTEGVSRR